MDDALHRLVTTKVFPLLYAKDGFG